MASVNGPYVLFSQQKPLAADGAPVTTDGVKRQRFRKDLIHAGTYKHPKDGWTLNVTPERMDKWVASFRAMRDNGRPVEFVKDHSFKADDKIGEIVDMYREGDTLYAVHEAVGDDAIALSQRVNTVSPWIEPAYRDGRNEYGEAIVHSSIVQQAVIDSQGPFQAIAASLAGTRAALLNITNGAMKMDLTELRKVLGAGDELTDENAVSMIRDRITKAESAKTDADQKARDKEAEVLQLQSKLTEAEKKGAKAEPDADQLEMLAEGASDRIDALVEKGNVTTAVAASLKKLFVGETGKRNAYALSGVYAGRERSLVRDVIDVLAQNNPVELGEKTKGQAMSLSFADLEDDAKKKANDEARTKMRAMAGIKD